MTKVDIISGFLGAGKTTFMKKLVAEAYKDEKVVIVENEFGEIGIDSGFLKDTGIEVSEINGGCVCCTLVGDFTKNLHEVIRTYHPDRILVEPSGVAKLSDVMVSVMDVAKEEEGIEMGALVTVINALKASKQMKAFGEFFVDQIEHATTVVLSRTQKAKDEQVEYCTKEVQEHNPKAVVVTTPWDEISGETLLKAIEGRDSLEVQALAEMHHEQEEAEHHHHDHDHEHHHDHDHDHEDHHDHDHEHHHGHDHEDHHDHDHEHHHDHDHEDHHDHGPGCTCGCHDHEHHHHHHADDVFVTWGKETPHKFTRETIEGALKAFAETEDYGYVVRSKGIVPSEEGTWIYFDLVDGEYEIREGEPDVIGRLVVIGTDVKEEDIEKLFGLS
ncbi:MAG: CobW family GTP-binding protein [Candidatus Weimeria sp.]|nr:CobW family GTP-binding protein [Candidatus Weimeria sp.]